MGTMQARKQAQPVEYDVEDDDALYQTRMPTSVRRYKPVPPVQRRQPENQEEPAIQGILIQRRRSSLSPKRTNGIASNAVAPLKTADLHGHKRFPIVAVLVGMVMTMVLVMSIAAFSSWWRVYQDDLHYGRPRTFQLDAVVGHGDSASNPTHFIFMNLRHQVEIIEIPGGDVSHTRIFIGPVLYGDGQDLTPVTGEVQDVNGDGKPDLIVHIQDQQIVFINDGTTFHPR